tara:strand:- start:5675 stop:5998 length:324 start_codon:yes stop_codon:yes gene_type:complete
MKKFFFIFCLSLFISLNSLAEFQLVPTNCTKKKIENCGAYLYDNKSGATYFCNSEECKEIQEALLEYQEQEIKGKSEKKESKKSKIPKFGKKKKEKKSKIPKFKKSE